MVVQQEHRGDGRSAGALSSSGAMSWVSCCPAEERCCLSRGHSCRTCSPALQAVPLPSELVCSQNGALMTLK